jgi:hypothetical protein
MTAEQELEKPKRPKYGGRKKGTPNKRDSEAALRAKQIADSGITPLEFFLAILRSTETVVGTDGKSVDKYSFEQRMEAAKNAAPYLHPKLQAVTLTGDGGGPIQFQQVTRVIRRL